MVAQWYVMRAAKQAGLTVMLDGQGGDEVFGGYRAFVGAGSPTCSHTGRLPSLAAELRAFGDVHCAGRARDLARPSVRSGAADPRRAGPRRAASADCSIPTCAAARRPSRRRARPSANGCAATRSCILTRRGLPELLRYEDRNSMAHSLEARVPFLDHRLVELAFSLPGGELIRSGRTKDVLRRALGRPPPASVAARRDKLGFVTPERRWFRGALGVFAAEIFASPEFAERGFVDPAARPAAARAPPRAARSTPGMELWRALNLELWARTYLDAPAAVAAS